MSPDYVNINVRLKDAGEGLVVESSWAEALLATEFGGDYRLHSDLLLAPLRRGDVVRCEIASDGSMQVVDIRQIRQGLLIGFEHPRNTDAAVKRVLKALRLLGYEVGRPFDGYVNVFVPGGELDHDFDFVPLPESWLRRELLDGPFRMRAAVEQIDFSLATGAVPNEGSLDHREPDDPCWARLEPEIALPSA